MPSLHELRRRLSGLVAPIVTPFDDNGAVSLSGLRRVLEFLADAGVAAVIPGDLVGEFFSLTLEERRLLLQESVNVAGGRIVVIALTADASLDNAIALAQFAQRAGADVIKLALPYPYTLPEPVILSYFRKLADAVELPFIVESSDELEIPLPVIGVLCEHPRFAGLEELGSDVGRLDQLYREFSERLVILPSGEPALLFLCLLGTPGLIAAECNFAPALCVSFWRPASGGTWTAPWSSSEGVAAIVTCFAMASAVGSPCTRPGQRRRWSCWDCPLASPAYPTSRSAPRRCARSAPR